MLGMRLFDVQLIGAMTLHSGKIAEMKTGEGKTFAAVPAVYLNALAGRGVHLVTVNDYLARRDAEWMSPIYERLGISVGVIGVDDARGPSAASAYAADVTYGTNAEFGFDYLRDNMAVRLEDCVQRGHYFCIVDEVDSILIDEARTPLIISGVPEAATDTYYRFARIVPTLKTGDDFEVDEKHRTASPTESGVDKVEKALGIENLYLDVNGNLVNHLIQALKAHSLYRKDKEYIVRDGELHDRGRVHRPRPRGPALLRGPAPGARGQGGAADPRGEPDPRHDHPPELLPHVREALGHDGHGLHRGQRVREDLRDRRGRRSRPTGR